MGLSSILVSGMEDISRVTELEDAGLHQRAGLWQFVLKGSEGPKITGTPGKSTPHGEHCRFCSSRIRFLLTLQGSNLICLRTQKECIFYGLLFSEGCWWNFSAFDYKLFVRSHSNVLATEDLSLSGGSPQKPLTFSYPVWWSISGANLPGLRDTQRTGKTRFLGVSVRVFLEEISIWIGELKITLTHVGGHLTNLRVWTEWKDGGRTNRLCLSWVDLRCLPSPALRHQGSWLSVVLLWNELHHLLSQASDLQRSHGSSNCMSQCF